MLPKSRQYYSEPPPRSPSSPCVQEEETGRVAGRQIQVTGKVGVVCGWLPARIIQILGYRHQLLKYETFCYSDICISVIFVEYRFYSRYIFFSKASIK